MPQPQRTQELSEKKDRFAFFESLPLFHHLSHNTLAYFMEHAREKDCAKGKVLFIQGESADYFYLVLNGWIKLFRETLDGDEAVIDVLTAHHMFGETIIFDGGRYPWSAQAVEDSRLIVWPTRLLTEQTKLHHQLTLNLLGLQTRYREQQDKELEHLKVQSAPQRIGCFLLRLCSAEGGRDRSHTIHLPYDKSLLAMRLGMKPETLSRALTTLKEKTGLSINGASVRIEDIERLSRYCCGACSDEFPCKDIG